MQKVISILSLLFLFGCYLPCYHDAGLNTISNPLTKSEIVGSYVLMNESQNLLERLGFENELTVITLRKDGSLHFQSYPNLELLFERKIGRTKFLDGNGTWKMTYTKNNENHLHLRLENCIEGRQKGTLYEKWWSEPIFYIEFFDPDYCYVLYFEKVEL